MHRDLGKGVNEEEGLLGKERWFVRKNKCLRNPWIELKKYMSRQEIGNEYLTNVEQMSSKYFSS